ncbi:MAG: hypothetical protein GX194_14550 [Clostridium sp.]|nr:hypothetical protein [Clostridium sp.]
MKTLIFEGVGWADADTSKATDVTNCRIRTRLRNNSGRVIYLEMGCCHFDNPKHAPAYAKNLNYATHIDHLFYCDSKWDDRRNFSRELQPLTNIHFEYNKENILKFVNEKLNCSFDDMIVYNNNEVRVHDTIEPLCSCAEGEYKNYQYKDIEININELNGIKPICGKEWFAVYKISHNSLIQLPYMKKHFEEMKKQNIQFKEEDNKVYFRWNKNGIITDLTIHTTGVSMGIGAEDIQKIIDLIKIDNINLL